MDDPTSGNSINSHTPVRPVSSISSGLHATFACQCILHVEAQLDPICLHGPSLQDVNCTIDILAQDALSVLTPIPHQVSNPTSRFHTLPTLPVVSEWACLSVELDP